MVGASKIIPELNKIDKLLCAVAKYFRKSPKEFGAREAFARRNGIRAVKFPRFCATRWASRADSIKVLIANLHVLMKYLEAKPRGAKVNALLAKLKDVETLCILFALHDILQIMNFLSLTFQNKSTLPHNIWTAVIKTKKQLKSLLGEDDVVSCHSLSKFLGELKIKKKHGVDTEKVEWVPDLSEPGVPLVGVRNDAKMHKFVSKLIKFIVQDLTNRFRDCRTVTAFKIFDPATYVGRFTPQELQSYGILDFDVLLARFCGKDKVFVCDRDDMLREFSVMKRCIYDFLRLGRNIDLSFHEVWRSVSKADGHLFPHMLKLVHIMCVIPTHTCDVERGFSMHRLVKHRLTSRLRVVTVDSMMRVKLNARDGLDGMNISSANSAVDNLDEIVAPMLKKYFSVVNDIVLADQIVHEVDGAEYDEDGDIPDEDENDDVNFEEDTGSDDEDP